MTIELPESLKSWVEQQAQLGGFASADAYVESILRQKRTRIRENIEQELLQSLDSGEPIEATAEFWEEQRRLLDESVRGQGKAAG